MKHSRLAFLIVLGTLTLLCSPAKAQASTTEIDILVLYTPAVLADYGTTAAITAHAAASVGSVNIALENSTVPIFFNLVGVELLDYVESTTSMAEDLYYITGEVEGFIDEALLAEVRGLRNAYGADIVSLFRNGGAGGAAGIAWLLNPTNPNQKFGYNVVSAASALNGQVLAHELGHNLSASHAHGEAGSSPSLAFARGHRFSAGGNDYRTIMSISFSHIRTPHFSNPDVSFLDEPTGVPIGESGEANNFVAFSTIAEGMAAFRLTQTAEPVFLEHPVGATIVSGQSARLDALVQGFPPLEIQWYSGLVDDRTQPVASTDALRERGGTDTSIETPLLTEPAFYWVELTNPNATNASSNVQVVVIPPLPGPQEDLVKQALETTVVGSASDELRQDVFLQASYVEKISVRISRQGSPQPALLRLAELDGRTINEIEIDPLSLTEWTGSLVSASTVDLPINAFLPPDRTYRLLLIPQGGDDSNRFLWLAGSDTVDPEAGIGTSNIASEGAAYVFTVHGQLAWTYHTWLASEPIHSALGQENAAVGNDGFANLARYALGFGAEDARSIIEPLRGEITTIDEVDILPFMFSVRRDAVDVGVIVETSTDLTGWDPLDSAHIHFIETIDGSRDVYEARLPLAGEPRQFIRVRIANPAPAP